MKKGKWIALIVVAVVLLAAVIGWVSADDAENHAITEICREMSPDGDVALVLYQIGEPKWSFGPVKARLSLEDSSGKELVWEDMSLMNDGCNVASTNILSVSWQENRVEVQMREFDTTKQYIFVLNLP